MGGYAPYLCQRRSSPLFSSLDTWPSHAFSSCAPLLCQGDGDGDGDRDPEDDKRGASFLLLKKGLTQLELGRGRGGGGGAERARSFASLLRLCGNTGALSDGHRLHAEIRRHAYSEGSVYLANLLVQMYGRCRSVEDARAVFEEMPRRNLFSWNLMLAACTCNGRHADSLALFRRMLLHKDEEEKDPRIRPDKFTLIPVLTAAANLPAPPADCTLIRNCISSLGLDSDVAVCNGLIHLLGKCGNISEARLIFDRTKTKVFISWNAMIAAYAQNGQFKEGLNLLQLMQSEGVNPDRITFLSVLSVNGATVGDLKSIHEYILHCGFDSDLQVNTALLNAHGKSGHLMEARIIFNKITSKDVISWNAMITAYAQNGYGKEALELFWQMGSEGVSPTKITFLSALEACACLAGLESGSGKAVRIGRAIHMQIRKSRFATDVALKAALVNMYGKCGSPRDAWTAFEEPGRRDVVVWNAMIAAYAHNGEGKKALQLFQQMEVEEGVPVDRVTFLGALDACADLESLSDGKSIHERILANGFGSDVPVLNALINMYGKCGSLENARSVFDEMAERDVISWTVMVAVSAQNGKNEEALELYQQMISQRVDLDRVTYLSVLDACTGLGSLEKGREIHKRIAALHLESDIAIASALLNMYGKCGSLTEAHAVFDGMNRRNVILWTNMISAYAQNNRSKEAFELFHQMDLEGAIPDSITFVNVLNACSHAGLVEEGSHFFLKMSKSYSITPSVEHFVCMIDLFRRAGYLMEAEDMMKNMPVQPDAIAWTILLGRS